MVAAPGQAQFEAEEGMAPDMVPGTVPDTVLNMVADTVTDREIHTNNRKLVWPLCRKIPKKSKMF